MYFVSIPDRDVGNDRHTIEAIPVDQRHLAQVRIKNLRKRYPDGNLAVRDFSLSMLEGQITCLLGHNGAGGLSVKCNCVFSVFLVQRSRFFVLAFVVCKVMLGSAEYRIVL